MQDFLLANFSQNPLTSCVRVGCRRIELVRGLLSGQDLANPVGDSVGGQADPDLMNAEAAQGVLGASVAVVRQLEQVGQDGGEWHDLADQLLVSAGNAASKIQARGLD